MTTRTYTVPGFPDQKYWIYEVDAYGNELEEKETGKLGYVMKTIEAEVSKPDITDVVIAIHGWNTEQDGNDTLGVFERWFTGISEELKERPYPANEQRKFAMIGVHWPSTVGSGKADENISDNVTFEENARRMRLLAETLGATDAEASRRIKALVDDVTAAATRRGTIEVTSHERRVASVQRALEQPYDAGDSEGEGEGDEVIGPHEPGTLFRFLKLITGTVFRPIEHAVFGQFLKRAELIGRGGVHTMLAHLQDVAPAKTRFHLLAHSLGGPAIFGALCGIVGGTYLLRKKVHSAILLQGAMDKRALARSERFDEVTVGVRPVAGPIAFSTSQTDSALKFFRIAHSEPIGLHGASKVDPLQLRKLALKSVPANYKICKGEVFNVIGDKFIDEGEGFAGGHLDVHGPELMQMVRQAFDIEVPIVEYLLETPLSRDFFRRNLPEVELPDKLLSTDIVPERKGGEGYVIE